ncbi:hypothetical protein DENIT_11087 [Pseudomonas veronii]|nr:hypothetical protein DENIT_11087 [Pseudomonas veronii]
MFATEWLLPTDCSVSLFMNDFRLIYSKQYLVRPTH